MNKTQALKALHRKYPRVVDGKWEYECWDGAHCWARTMVLNKILLVIRVADDGNGPNVSMGTIRMDDKPESDNGRRLRQEVANSMERLLAQPV